MPLEVKFVDGPLANSFFTVYEAEALIKLLQLCVAQDVATLCGIKKEDQPDQETLLYFNGSGVCLFRDTGNMVLDVWQDDEISSSKLVPVTDARWGTIYFLPTNCFVSADRALPELEKMLKTDKLEPLTPIPQEGEEVMLAYRSLTSEEH